MMRDINFHLKYCILGGFKIEEFRKEFSSALILSVRLNPDWRKISYQRNPPTLERSGQSISYSYNSSTHRRRRTSRSRHSCVTFKGRG